MDGRVCVGSNVPELVVSILSIVDGVVCNLLPLHLHVTTYTLAKCLLFEAISSRFFQSIFDEAVFLYWRKRCADKQCTCAVMHIFLVYVFL